MAVQAKGSYVALAWRPDSRIAGVFDSPDRILGSGAHLMGLLFPGSNGANRDEGSILPYAGERLPAHTPFVAHSWIIGGRGDSVAPAIIKYAGLGTLPPVPESGLRFDRYVRLAAAGWLDSKIWDHLPNRDLFRHAWPGGFSPQPAADVALWMHWLAIHAGNGARDGALASRLGGIRNSRHRRRVTG